MASTDQQDARQPVTQERTWSRRGAIAAASGLAFGLAGLGARHATGQQETNPATPPATPAILPAGAGEMPTSGGARPGPVSDQPPARESIASVPVTMIVPAAGVDAEVEVRTISDGRMEDPTGPWVVAWYQQSAELGEVGNAMFAGHVDYWGVGPSVFYNVRNLAEGDEIAVTGEDGSVFSYGVEWVETIAIEDLISGRMAEIAAPTSYQAVTLFTCGGEFDYVNGEYLSRTVVRARRLPPAPAEATPPA